MLADIKTTNIGHWSYQPAHCHNVCTSLKQMWCIFGECLPGPQVLQNIICRPLYMFVYVGSDTQCGQLLYDRKKLMCSLYVTNGSGVCVCICVLVCVFVCVTGMLVCLSLPAMSAHLCEQHKEEWQPSPCLKCACDNGVTYCQRERCSNSLWCPKVGDDWVFLSCLFLFLLFLSSYSLPLCFLPDLPVWRLAHL